MKIGSELKEEFGHNHTEIFSLSLRYGSNSKKTQELGWNNVFPEFGSVMSFSQCLSMFLPSLVTIHPSIGQFVNIKLPYIII